MVAGSRLLSAAPSDSIFAAAQDDLNCVCGFRSAPACGSVTKGSTWLSTHQEDEECKAIVNSAQATLE